MPVTHLLCRCVLVVLLLSLNMAVHSRIVSAQGVPIEPTPTPEAELPTMPLQGTPVEATVTAVPEAERRTSAAQPAGAEYVPGVVLVGVEATANRGGVSAIDAALAQVGGTAAERLFTSQNDGAAARGESAPAIEVYRVTLPADADVAAAVKALQGSGVAFAEPDYVARAIPVEMEQGRGKRVSRRRRTIPCTAGSGA